MRGLQAPDPAAANVMGLANMVMQGVDQFQKRQERQEDRAFNQKLRDRQLRDFEIQDEVAEGMAEMQSFFSPVERRGLTQEELGGVSQATLRPEDDITIEAIMGKEKGPEWWEVSVGDVIDLEKYSPHAQMELTKRFLNQQAAKVDASRNIRQFKAENNERKRLESLGLLQETQQMLKMGDIDAAVGNLLHIYNKNYRDGKVVEVDEEGNVIITNQYTDETGVIGNINDDQFLSRTINELARIHQNPEEYHAENRANAVAQTQMMAEALTENLEVLTHPDTGQRIYSAVSPDPETGQVHRKYYSRPPQHWNDPSEIVDNELISTIQENFRTIGEWQEIVDLERTRALTDETRAKTQERLQRIHQDATAPRYDMKEVEDVTSPIFEAHFVPLENQQQLNLAVKEILNATKVDRMTLRHQINELMKMTPEELMEHGNAKFDTEEQGWFLWKKDVPVEEQKADAVAEILRHDLEQDLIEQEEGRTREDQQTREDETPIREIEGGSSFDLTSDAVVTQAGLTGEPTPPMPEEEQQVDTGGSEKVGDWGLTLRRSDGENPIKVNVDKLNLSNKAKSWLKESKGDITSNDEIRQKLDSYIDDNMMKVNRIIQSLEWLGDKLIDADAADPSTPDPEHSTAREQWEDGADTREVIVRPLVEINNTIRGVEKERRDMMRKFFSNIYENTEQFLRDFQQWSKNRYPHIHNPEENEEVITEFYENKRDQQKTKPVSLLNLGKE